MPLAPTDVNRHRTTDQGARIPAFFFQIPLIPPSSVVHSSARFSFNSQFSYIFVCRKRQILSSRYDGGIATHRGSVLMTLCHIGSVW